MSEASEKISYLVANYNNGWAFPDLLDSLESQSDKNWLCVFCDDASTDDSWERVQELAAASAVAQQIRFLRNEQNLGYVRTLQRLIDCAPTDIVAILDADDALEPIATEELLLAYTRIEKAGFVCSKFRYLNEDLREEFGILGEGIPFGCSALQGGFLSHLKSFRRKLYEQTEGLDERLLYAEDRDLVLKLEERTRPLFINKALYRYRCVENSLSRAPRTRALGFYRAGLAYRNALARRGVPAFSRHLATLLFWLRIQEPPFRYFSALRLPLQGMARYFSRELPREVERDGEWHH